MKATLRKISTSRSLQRRWLLTDAEPVHSYLHRDLTFVPADLRIWWQTAAGQPVEDHTLSIYAWPAERELSVSAHWTNGYNHSPLPTWIQELSDVVHDDLIENTTSPNTGTEDTWAYSVDRRWTLEHATPVRSLRYPNEPFVPAELSIWHSCNAVDSSHDRHRINAYPGDPDQRLRMSADWGGGVDWEGKPRYNEDLPQWIRDMANEQYEELVAFATQGESDRRTR
ncbi:hypothetical protein GCM10023063_16370 [Arthrobacter methylotrophus]|uniref:Uncharacterized protein n=1 Tax=Arthrobacter methylotrophus TaxID=121291 RepID=A0ABV5UNG0_9MICC